MNRSQRWTALALAMACLTTTQTPCLAELDAVTRARYDLHLGFTVGGKVTQILAKPGDHANKDQLLIELENEEGKSLVELYSVRATSDLAEKSADAELELARVEEKALRTAAEHDAAKPIEVERAIIKTRLAELQSGMAIQRADEARHQLNQAEARRDQYLLKAPTDGIVDLILVQEGEMVEALKPVLRLVVTDPLWVDAAVPLEDTLDLNVGDPAWIKSTLPGYDQPIQGRIIHVTRVADAASETRLVRIEVPNANQMPAGGTVRVRFEPPDKSWAATLPKSPVSSEAQARLESNPQ